MRVILAASFGLAVDNTITPEPGQTALATDESWLRVGMVAVAGECWARTVLPFGMAKRSIDVLTAVTALHCSHRPRSK